MSKWWQNYNFLVKYPFKDGPNMKNKPECANNSYNHHKFISLLLMQSWLQNISKYVFILPLLFSLCGSSVGVTDSRWVSQERNSYPDCHSLASLCVCVCLTCVYEREKVLDCVRLGGLVFMLLIFRKSTHTHTYTLVYLISRDHLHTSLDIQKPKWPFHQSQGHGWNCRTFVCLFV